MIETIMTIKEFAKRYKVNEETVRRLIREHKIPGAFKLGGTWRIREVTNETK